LFVGNLPYQATEEDLRSHFGQVGPPTQIVRPLDRETGRARGFAFVEFADRALAEDAIKRFDGQLFMGRPLAVSEARAREDRGPGGPRPGGFSPRPPGTGYGARPGGGAGYGGPRSGEGPGGGAPGAPSRDRNFGPPAPPKGSKKGPKAGFKKDENRPRGPIPTKFTGRMYDLDEVNEEDTADDATPDFMKHDEGEKADEGKDEGKEE
jgi:RNA recognition motif-containing protein